MPPLEIDQEIVRKNEANFKLLDDRNISGGYHTVATIADRDAILSSLRKTGMLVYVTATDAIYKLRANLIIWDTFTTGGGSGLPPFAGVDGAVVVEENNPTPDAIFRRLSADDIDPAFTITSFAGGPANSELGTAIVNPAFTASYNAAIASATLDDGVLPLPVSLPATAFGYNNGGGSGLPPKTYQQLTINGTQVWTLGAVKAPSGPTKAAAVSANLGLTRRYFDIVPVPGAYTEGFIKSLANNQLASSHSGTFVLGAGTSLTKIYLCWPTAFGNPASIQGPVPFAFPMVKVATAVPFTNLVGPGYPIPGGYDIWESANFISSPFTVVVS